MKVKVASPSCTSVNPPLEHACRAVLPCSTAPKAPRKSIAVAPVMSRLGRAMMDAWSQGRSPKWLASVLPLDHWISLVEPSMNCKPGQRGREEGEGEGRETSADDKRMRCDAMRVRGRGQMQCNVAREAQSEVMHSEQAGLAVALA